MSTDLDESFNMQFININLKLKRRFMRKPNMADCVKEFIALGVRCEYAEQPTFAGHAYVGAAKCAASAGNSLEEAEHYMTAGSQFMKAQKKLCSMKFSSPDRENLEAAICCYITAFNKYPEQSLIRGSIFMRLANELVSLGHKEEALSYYTQALDYVKDVATKQNCYKTKLELEMECGKYDVAWATANKMADADCSPNTKEFPESYLAEIQINRILLTLLTKPLNEDEPPSLRQLFTDLMNDDDNDKLPFNPELKLKLQSIVRCAMSGDVVSLVAVAAAAGRHLSARQEALLQALVTMERAEHLAIT